jgi:hypothetical protein
MAEVMIEWVVQVELGLVYHSEKKPFGLKGFFRALACNSKNFLS